MSKKQEAQMTVNICELDIPPLPASCDRFYLFLSILGDAVSEPRLCPAPKLTDSYRKPSMST